MVATSVVLKRAIRGGKNPLFDALTSSLAEAWGVVVPMPVWERAVHETNKKRKMYLISLFNENLNGA